MFIGLIEVLSRDDIGVALEHYHDVKLQYVSSTILKILKGSCAISNDLKLAINFNADTNIGINVMGINGMAQSATLSGTVSIASGSVTIAGVGTSFLSDFIIGDIIYLSNNEGFQITNISSNTSMTVRTAAAATYSNLTYKRGGLAPSATYYLYFCKGVSVKDSAIISPRNISNTETLIDVPSDLSSTDVRQIMQSAIGGSNGAVLELKTDSSKNLIAFTSANMSSARCVAWAHVEGLVDVSVTGTYVQSGTTITVTVVNHGHKVGQSLYLDITSGSGVDNLYTVASVIDANNFTCTAGTSLNTSGNLTLQRRKIKSNENIAYISRSSDGLTYWAGFKNALPDANFMAVGSVNSESLTASSGACVFQPFLKGNGGYGTRADGSAWGFNYICMLLGSGVYGQPGFANINMGVFR